MDTSGGIQLTYEKLLEQNAQQQAQILLLTEELNRLKKLTFGVKSERFISAEDSFQMNLNLGGESDKTAAIVTSEEITYTLRTPEQSESVQK